ncbi:hypothetical protein [Metabacillus litoralis]|uniref:hypothetical protein n=1 Tax=Metabacillus litoralis TaxID=152268 RepID=UPI001CFEAEE5|nr:hypothetical protein [Metabacillus litoralis]
MKSLKTMDIVILFAITLLFIYDYFPNNAWTNLIPKIVVIVLIIGLFLFSLLFKRYRNVESKEILQWQIISTAYFVFIIGLFTALGGKSSSGVSLNNGFLWIALFISVVEMTFQWKKIKQSKA